MSIKELPIQRAVNEVNHVIMSSIMIGSYDTRMIVADVTTCWMIHNKVKAIALDLNITKHIDVYHDGDQECIFRFRFPNGNTLYVTWSDNDAIMRGQSLTTLLFLRMMKHQTFEASLPCLSATDGDLLHIGVLDERI